MERNLNSDKNNHYLTFGSFCIFCISVTVFTVVIFFVSIIQMIIRNHNLQKQKQTENQKNQFEKQSFYSNRNRYFTSTFCLPLILLSEKLER